MHASVLNPISRCYTIPTDLEKLRGTWSITSLEADGNTMADAFFAGAKVIVNGDRFTSLGMGGTFEGTVSVDQRKKPKTIDIDFTAGDAAGTRNVGIYELRGEKWTICLATTGNRRPRSFKTRPTSGLVLETLARESTRTAVPRPNAKAGRAAAPQSEKEERAAVPASSAPATAWEGDWQMTAAVFDGKPMAESMIRWATRVTRGDITSVLAGPQVMLRARFTLDESSRPVHVEYVNLEGSNKGKTQLGIAELEGDTLRVCMAPPKKPRPSSFVSIRGDGRSLTEWRRTAT